MFTVKRIVTKALRTVLLIPFVKKKRIESLAGNQDVHCIFVENTLKEKNPVCAFILYEKKDHDSVFIHDVCSVTEKGMGVGVNLMSLVFKKAVEQKAGNVHLIATEKSVSFYENLFFETIGEEDGGTKMINKNVQETADCLHTVYGLPKLK